MIYRVRPKPNGFANKFADNGVRPQSTSALPSNGKVSGLSQDQIEQPLRRIGNRRSPIQETITPDAVLHRWRGHDHAAVTTNVNARSNHRCGTANHTALGPAKIIVQRAAGAYCHQGLRQPPMLAFELAQRRNAINVMPLRRVSLQHPEAVLIAGWMPRLASGQ